MLLVSALLAMGSHTPLFRWTHWFHLRIPARYCYLVNLSLVVLGLGGLSRLPAPWLLVVVLLQAWEFVMRFPRLSPTAPYCQRWQHPTTALQMPLITHLLAHRGPGRVSGLPYPHRTGLLAQIPTLDYNGASRPQWMTALRPVEGGHDGLFHDPSGRVLEALGARYAFTYRPLSAPWQPTEFPHLWRRDGP